MKNLKKLRTERRMSQQKLAEHFNLSQQSIYKYENQLAEPSIQTLKDFASFFHTTVDELIDYQITPNSSDDRENFSADELHVLLLYRQLSEKSRSSITTILEELTLCSWH